MAITNHERVGKALGLFKAGLGPFVQREVQGGAIESGKQDAHKLRRFADDSLLASKPVPEWDIAGLLKLMWEAWNDVVRNLLAPAERGFGRREFDAGLRWTTRGSRTGWRESGFRRRFSARRGFAGGGATDSFPRNRRSGFGTRGSRWGPDSG